MYSLLYCQDIKEYYICKSKNVIQEEDGVCLVAFRAKLVLGGYASKHNLQRIQKSLGEDPFLYVQEADQNEEVAEDIDSMDHIVSENASNNEIIEDNKTDAFAEDDIDMSEEETSCDYNEMADLFTTKQYVINAGISEDKKTTDNNKPENDDQKTELTKLKTVPESELQKRTYICCFCKVKPKNFVKHMITFHNNEEEVKNLVTLPKDSPERKNYLRKMKMKATNYFKLMDEINNRHSLEERHTRNKSIIKPSRCLKFILGSKLMCHKLKMIYSDDLFVLFGNSLCERFNCDTQIRTQLQVFANIINKLSCNSNTSDLRSVFQPKNIQTILNCGDKALRHYETRYLIKFGKFLLQYYTSKKDFQMKIDTEEAIKLLYGTLREKRVKNELPNKQLHLPIIIEVKTVKKETETSTVVHQERETERRLHLPIPILKQEKQPKIESDEQSEDTPKKPYPLRQKARNDQRLFLQEQMSNEVFLDLIDEEEKFENHATHVILNNKRYLFCYYCEKLYATQIIGHLQRMHAEEEEVKKFLSFSKGSVQRKRLITKICLQGKHKYETAKLNKNVNDLMSRKTLNHLKQNNRKRNESEEIHETVLDEMKKKVHHHHQQNTNKENEFEENHNEEETQHNITNNQKEELDVQDNETTGNESTNAEQQWKELEEFFEITTHDNKLEFKEDDSKESLMCMLTEHVNCSPTC